jgi:outer membrane protein OmpA-like peptidoglycan-associated protein
MIFEQIYANETQSQAMITSQKGGSWARPEALPGVNSELKSMVNGGFSLSNNSTQIWFHSSRAGGLGNLDIWMMEKSIIGTWLAPKNLARPINSLAAEVDPFLSADGKFLFFTRITDKKTDKGTPCGKIFMAERSGKDSWKNPVELPAPINAGCECAARMLHDNKTLLFASQREGGSGGLDLYRSQLQADNSWSAPIPLSSLNTAEDDRYVSVPAGGGVIYHSGEAKTGGKDLFRSKLPDALAPDKIMLIQGTVRNASNNLLIQPRITVTALSTNKSYQYFGAADGTYTISLPTGDQYDVAVQSTTGNFTFYSAFYDASKLSKYEEKTLDVKLSPIKSDVLFGANNISFKNNTDTLNASSFADMARILTLLKSNITMRLEVGVHTDRDEKDTTQLPEYTHVIIDTLGHYIDSTGRELPTLKYTYASNNTVAQAHAVIEWLHRKGIPYERIIPVGYGNSKPPITPPSDPKLLRRVELKVIHE